MPVERMWPMKAERVHGLGSGTQRWNESGSARNDRSGRIAAASFCRAAVSVRMKRRIMSAGAVPSIQRVARATVSGEAMTVGCPERGREGPPGARVRRHHVGGAKAGTDAFGKAGDVPGDVGRDAGESDAPPPAG